MKVRPTPGITFLAVLIGAVAVGLLYWSWVSRASIWWSGLLVQVGSTLALFVPLLVVGRGIEARLDRVSKRQDQISMRQEETASDVTRLTEEVARTQADLRETREQLSQLARERITENKSKDSVLFKTVGEAPSQADVLNSLIRAKEMGIIPDQGCRVDLISDCYLRFKPEWKSGDPIVRGSQAPDVVELILERIDATPLEYIEWDAESAPSEIAVRVAEAMQASGVYSGDKIFDAGKYLRISPVYLLSATRALLEVRFILYDTSSNSALHNGWSAMMESTAHRSPTCSRRTGWMNPDCLLT